MKKFFIFTYPKLTIYVIAIFLAYLFFQMPAIHEGVQSLKDMQYLPIFFGGLLFSAGFTTPLATGFFLTINPVINIYTAAFIGGLGALIADLGIFSFIKLSFMDEFHKLERTSFIKHVLDGTKKIFSKKIRTLIVYFLAAIIIASPLPDELAVTMLAGFTRIHPYEFTFISFLGNSLGIYLLLSI